MFLDFTRLRILFGLSSSSSAPYIKPFLVKTFVKTHCFCAIRASPNIDFCGIVRYSCILVFLRLDFLLRGSGFTFGLMKVAFSAVILPVSSEAKMVHAGSQMDVICIPNSFPSI